MGVTALASKKALFGQAAAPVVPNVGAIDCHNHFASPACIKALTAKEGKHH